MRQYPEQVIVDYLTSLDIKHMEFFDEMYDHIVSSFEGRENQNQSVKNHIHEVIEPDFGGANGIKKVMQTQQKLRQKAINKRIKDLMAKYLFGWPSLLTTILVAAAIILANSIFAPKTVFLSSIVVSVFVPICVVGFKHLRFWYNCKELRLPYRNSDLNTRILEISRLGISSFNIFIYLFGLMIWGSPKAAIEALMHYPIVHITISVCFILYGLVCIELYRERFVQNLPHVAQ